MDEKDKGRFAIDIKQVWKTLWNKRKLFLKVWVVTFILSCIWILPQPRYYTTEVSIAPESSEAKAAGGLASLASSFGVNIGSGSSDAIYPQLYPDLFTSTEFLVGLFDIQVTTLDGDLTTDYYDYMRNHQKKNFLTLPFTLARQWVMSLFKEPDPDIPGTKGKRFNPFHLSKPTSDILGKVQDNIGCAYSRVTDVVTISVKDQDPLVCALLADSVKEHLQAFITDYRTKKSRIDYEYYEKLTTEAKEAYDKARRDYAAYADSHQDVFLQSVKTKIDDLENEMQLKYNVYTAMNTQLEAALAKVQENTPVFTTLTNATVPIKPAGPKRMIFVAIMLFLATVGTIVRLFRKQLIEWF